MIKSIFVQNFKNEDKLLFTFVLGGQILHSNQRLLLSITVLTHPAIIVEVSIVWCFYALHSIFA